MEQHSLSIVKTISTCPSKTIMNEDLQVTPAELRAAPDLLRETPTGTNPEAPATAQTDTPGQKLEFPGEIQAPDWFLLAPPNGHYKPQTTKGQCGCSSAKSPGDIPLPGEQGLKLLLPSHLGHFQPVTRFLGFPEHLGFTVAPLFFVSPVRLPLGDLR